MTTAARFGEEGRFLPALLAGLALHGALAFAVARHVTEGRPVPVLHAATPLHFIEVEEPAVVPVRAEPASDNGTGRMASKPAKLSVARRLAVATPKGDAADMGSALVGSAVATESDDGAATGTESGTESGGGNGGESATGVATPKTAALVATPACDVFFPYTAPDDKGLVAIAVAVNSAGSPGSVVVESESPAGEGFASAAKSCVRYARFRPATDVAGTAVASIAHLRLEFSRRR